jgi:PIN domain nuclease of toxin-antitoxin system
MNLLLDTQLYLWFLADSRHLTASRRKAIEHAAIVYVSAVSIWEATIKTSLGRLKADPQALIDGLVPSGFLELPLHMAHAAPLVHLPFHHRDPFDRLLICQAMTESLQFLTTDRTLAPYSHLVRVI